MSTTIGIMAMLIAIAALIYFSFKGVAFTILCIGCTLFVAVFNNVPLWDALGGTWVPSFAGVIQSYVLIFMASSCYASIMDATGATVTIGRQFVKWFGTKHALTVCWIIVAVLNYGGISLWVVMFAAGPIMYGVLKEADLPRHFTQCCLSIGATTFTMTCLPGSTALTNVIPSEYLGTTLTAAPVLGLIAAAMMIVMIQLYLRWQEKRSRRLGEHWSFPEGYDASKYEVDESKLPTPVNAFIPIIVLLVMVIGASFAKLSIASNTTLLVVLAMTVAFVLCWIINGKYIDKEHTNVNKLLTGGTQSGLGAMLGLACLVGFGSVVSQTEAYQQIVHWLIGLDLSVYFKGVFSTSVIAGITGSSSGGARLALSQMGEYFINSGCNLDVLHRLISIGAGTLDSLPHSSGYPAMFAFFGLTYKEAYRHCFWVSVIIPLITVSILLIAVTALGI